MGQKIHPVAVRLQENRTFDSAWYSEDFAISLKRELLARKAIGSFFKIISQNIPDLFLGRIFYQRSHQKTILTLFIYKGKVSPKGRRGPIAKRKRSGTGRSRFFFRYSDLNHASSSDRQKKNYNSYMGVNWFQTQTRETCLSQTKKSKFLEKFANSFYKKVYFSPFGLSQKSQTATQANKKLFGNTNPKKKNWVWEQKGPQNLAQQVKSLISPIEIEIAYRCFFRQTNSTKNIESLKKLFQFELEKFKILLFASDLKRRKAAFGDGKLSHWTKPVMPSEQKKLELEKQNILSNNLKKARSYKLFIGNQTAHPLLSHLENSLTLFFQENIFVRPIICREVNYSAIFLAEQIAQMFKKHQKKKKVPYRLIKKLLIGDPDIGIRIQCSGRLGGVEMAKKLFLKKGQTSLNVFSQKIDFCQRTVLTKYGIIGIKVWVSYLKKA